MSLHRKEVKKGLMKIKIYNNLIFRPLIVDLHFVIVNIPHDKRLYI